MSDTVKNPKTGRSIKIGAAAFNALIKEGYTHNIEKGTLEPPASGGTPKIEAPKRSTPKKPSPKAPVAPPAPAPVASFLPPDAEDLEIKNLHIPTDFKPKKIIHMADIHIPIDLHVKRAEEYKIVFDNLMSSLESTPDIKSSIIVIAGDLVNTKLRTENETLVLAQDFLQRLSRITYTVVTVGNHDFAENNSDRTDSVTALCYTIPSISVLKRTGVYRAGDVLLVFNSLWKEKTQPCLKFIHHRDLTTSEEFKTVALYHGSVIGGRNDNGTPIDEPKQKKYPSKGDFSGFDLCLLGHIHKYQKLSETVAYSGSLIQQNFGESPEYHGYLEWDLSTMRSTHREVHNPYVYLSLQVRDGKLSDCDDILTRYSDRKLRLRLIVENTPESSYDEICAKLQREYTVESLVKKKITAVPKKVDGEEIRPVQQTEIDLIETLLEGEANKILRDGVLKLHERYHTKREENINTWKIVSLSFSNLLIYGNNMDNTIKFQDGITDICAPNTYGKSSIIHILLYALYGSKCGVKFILNKDQREGWSKIVFIHNGETYQIYRTIGTKTRSSRAQTESIIEKDIRFTKNDGETLLNAESVTSTQAKINALLGPPDLFLNNNIIKTKVGSKSLLTLTPQELSTFFTSTFGISFEKARDMSKDHKKIKEDALHKKKGEYKSVEEGLARIKSMPTVESEQEVNIDREISQLKLEKDEISSQIALIKEKVKELSKYTDVGVEAVVGEPTPDEDDTVESLDMMIQQLNKTIFKEPKSLQLVSGEIADLESKYSSLQERRPQDSYESILERLAVCEERLRALLLKKTSLATQLASIEGRGEELDEGDEEGEESEGQENEDDNIDNKILVVSTQINQHRKGLKYVTSDINGLERETAILPTTPEEALRAELQTLTDYQQTAKSKEELIRLKRVPLEVPDKIQLPPRYREVLDGYKSELEQYNDGLTDPSVITFEGQKYILLDDHQRHCHNTYLKQVKLKYENLLGDIQKNKETDKIIEKNEEIARQNILIDRQLSWLRRVEILSDIAIIEKRAILARLYEIRSLEQKLKTLQSQKKVLLRLEIETISSEIDMRMRERDSLNSNKSWFVHFNKVSGELEERRGTRDKLIANNKLVSERDSLLRRREAKLYQISQRRAQMEDKLSMLSVERDRLTGLVQLEEKKLRKIIEQNTERTLRDEELCRLSDQATKMKGEITELEAEIEIHKEYERLFHVKCIPSLLLEQKMRIFERAVNAIFNAHTKYTFICRLSEEDDKGSRTIDIKINKGDSWDIDVANLSGFESILLTIAINRTLLDISNSKGNIFVIDESLDCIDQERWAEKLPKIFDIIRSTFASTLIISHREIPDDIVEAKIKIRNVDGRYSYIE
jgi:DNA repair exonuclease SbcCD ATPase subunit/DNA repair exonuclease SbcCD nuclease subunit